jgi:hypothetical protein
LLIAGELPVTPMVWSFCTSKVVPDAMFNVPPSIRMLPVPVQVAPKLLLTVRPFPTALLPVPLIDSDPLAVVVPVSIMLPPLQLVVPDTVSVPLPPSAPLESVKLVTLAGALSVAVPPLPMTASSPAPGGPLGLQLPGVNQSPEATFHR